MNKKLQKSAVVLALTMLFCHLIGTARAGNGKYAFRDEFNDGFSADDADWLRARLSSLTAAFISKLEARIYESSAEMTENDLIYLDYYAAMIDEKEILKDGLSYDGLHPNADGCKVMQPLAEQAIKRALKK